MVDRPTPSADATKASGHTRKSRRSPSISLSERVMFTVHILIWGLHSVLDEGALEFGRVGARRDAATWSVLGSRQTRAMRGDRPELRDWWYSLWDSFPRLPHMPSIHCKNEVRKKTIQSKVVSHFPDVVCCIVYLEATTGPSNGAAPVSLEKKRLMLVKAKNDFHLAPIALSRFLVRGHDLFTHRLLCYLTCQWALYTSPISVVSKIILLFHDVPRIWDVGSIESLRSTRS